MPSLQAIWESMLKSAETKMLSRKLMNWAMLVQHSHYWRPWMWISEMVWLWPILSNRARVMWCTLIISTQRLSYGMWHWSILIISTLNLILIELNTYGGLQKAHSPSSLWKTMDITFWWRQVAQAIIYPVQALLHAISRWYLVTPGSEFLRCCRFGLSCLHRNNITE